MNAVSLPFPSEPEHEPEHDPEREHHAETTAKLTPPLRQAPATVRLTPVPGVDIAAQPTGELVMPAESQIGYWLTVWSDQKAAEARRLRTEAHDDERNIAQMEAMSCEWWEERELLGRNRIAPGGTHPVARWEDRFRWLDANIGRLDNDILACADAWQHKLDRARELEWAAERLRRAARAERQA